MACMYHRGMVGRIKRTTLHCYTQNMKALGLLISENKIFFFKFFPLKAMGANDPQGGGRF